MTLDEMKLAVCEKLPNLISLHANGKHYWSASANGFINWPTEGLQVCHEAEKLLGDREDYYHIILRRVCKGGTPAAIRATYEQRLEALCRVWYPERFQQ